MASRKLTEFPNWLQPFVTEEKRIGSDGRKQCFFIAKNVPFSIALENKLSHGSKLIVTGNCIVCHKPFTAKWISLQRRVVCKDKEICSCCALKYAVSTPEWKRKNSESQKITQNRPDVLQRMSNAVKASKTPEVIEKHSKASKFMWATAGYREKHKKAMKNAFTNMSDDNKERMSHNNGFYTGYYESKWGKMYFASSWELAFIVWCENNQHVIDVSRKVKSISYVDDGGYKRTYFPDFYVTTDEQRYVVEVKGHFDNNVQAKANAATLALGDVCYMLLFERDLIRLGAIRKGHNAKSYCEQLQHKITCLMQARKNHYDLCQES